jgi:hypothetical protein
VRVEDRGHKGSERRVPRAQEITKQRAESRENKRTKSVEQKAHQKIALKSRVYKTQEKKGRE